MGVLSALLLIVLSTTAVAQTERQLAALDLEELMKIEVPSVFGASKFLQKVIDAPAAVSVVTARDIDTYGYRTLSDIIRSVPGFNVTYDRNYSYVGVRGFQRPGDYNSRVLLLIDGHRLNDPIYDEAYIGTEFAMDVGLIDRVELVRGPSSSIYGTNAFFSVINVITKKGQAVSGMRVSGDAGSLHTGSGRATFGANFDNGLDLLLSGSRYRSRGQQRLHYREFDDPATNRGVAENLDSDAAHRLFGSLSFKGLSLQGVYGSRAKQVPTAAYDSRFNDPRLKTNDAQGWIDLRYVRALRGDWQLTARVYYDRVAYDGRYPSNDADADVPSISVLGDYAYAKWWGAEVYGEKVLVRRHKLTAGGEYRDRFSLRQGGFDVASGAVYLDDRRASRDSAIFVEDQYTLHEKLLLNAGIRWDRYETFGSTTNPRLGLIFKPVEKTAIKALWGTAFRAPNAYEMYYSVDLNRGNPHLEPETIRTGELVFERYLSDRYRAMASAYVSHVDGLISQTVQSDGGLTFLNLDTVGTRGVEAELEARWRSSIAVRFSYSYQNARNLVTGTPLANSARHLATANVTVPLVGRRLLAGMDLHYVGRVETLDGSFTDRVLVPNLTLTTRNMYKGLSLSASVYNLFNSRYGHPGSGEHRQNIIYQDGRTFRVGLEYAWVREK